MATRKPVIEYNNIHNNIPYDLYNRNDYNVNASYNWWGTTDEVAIQALIYDWSDYSLRGVVRYVPYLTSPVSENIIPEFPSWIILPLLLITGLVLLSYRKHMK